MAKDKQKRSSSILFIIIFGHDKPNNIENQMHTKTKPSKKNITSSSFNNSLLLVSQIFTLFSEEKVCHTN